MAEEKKKSPPYSKKKAYIRAYLDKKAQVSLTVTKDEKACWKRTASREGKSLTRFITDIVDGYCRKNGKD